MERLIPVVNKLQNVFDKTGSGANSIELPRIVVVGSQSSGKSSVLENFVGKPFLPRGKDLVTRCPIILMLNQRPGKEEWCEFEHRGNMKFRIEDAEREILRRTTEITGDNTGISHEAIKLSVYSPTVLTLTVIDLPGLTKVAVQGQAADTPKRIEELALHYVSQASTVILAVSCANVDIANSESINLAKQVDPLQARTLAVLTKLDLAGDMNDVLTGKILPMKLGIVGVVNRSQEDIDDRISIQQAIEKENKFLRDNYGPLADKHGTVYLALRLNQVLMHHIKKCFPTLDIKIKELFVQKEQELATLGASDEENMSDKDKLQCLTTIIKKFEKVYAAHINGQRRTEMDPSELSFGAKIDFIFKHTLAKDLSLLDPLSEIKDIEIMNAVKNSEGVLSQLFHPQGALQHLIKREVAKIKPVTLHCLNLVHQELIAMIDKCLPNEERFPLVNQEIVEVMSSLLQSRALIARQVLENYVDVQASSAATFDPEYFSHLIEKMGKVNAVGLGDIPASLVFNGNGASDPLLTLSCGENFSVESSATFTDQQTTVFETVKALIIMFFNIVRRQVQDHVPKSLLHSLIYYTVDNLNIELTTNLCPMVETLIKEAEEVVEKRKNIRKELEGITTAGKILDEVRNSNFA